MKSGSRWVSTTALAVALGLLPYEARADDESADFESVDEEDVAPEVAAGLPVVRGGPEMNILLPYGVGLGAAAAVFIGDRVQLAGRYNFLVATFPSQGTDSRQGHLASLFAGVALLRGRGRRAVRLVIHEEQELYVRELYYTTGVIPTHHYLLLEGGVLTVPYAYARCSAACDTDSKEFGPQLNFQGLLVGGGLRYLYYYKVDSDLMTRATRYALELAGHFYLPALNAPSGSYHAFFSPVDSSRPGFLLEVAFQLGSWFPGTLTLAGGLAPSFPTPQLGFRYGYYFD